MRVNGGEVDFAIPTLKSRQFDKPINGRSMITQLRLSNFKNFRDASISLGPLTLLVGTNASGKSNLRDAFRFLHGISRGYSLAEVIGEKWIEGGVLQWKGIRGGTRETSYFGESVFAMSVSFSVPSLMDLDIGYHIEIELPQEAAPRVRRESLYLPFAETLNGLIFDSHPADDPPGQKQPGMFINVRLPRDDRNRKHGKNLTFSNSQPVLTQFAQHEDAPKHYKQEVNKIIQQLASIRFLDLAPDAMRMPSVPGQTILGDRGENLSSALLALCEDPAAKGAAIEWIRELTPSDVVDFEFVSDQTGRVLVSLVESDGHKTSAYSASDGTLRFLAMIVAMLGVKPAKFYFFEELENGIHPTRLHLLLQLIEQRASRGDMQVFATTHSPQLLAFLNAQSREHASFVYRLDRQREAKIRRILDLPDVRRVIEEQDLSRLHSTGWLEDAVAFLEGAPHP